MGQIESIRHELSRVETVRPLLKSSGVLLNIIYCLIFKREMKSPWNMIISLAFTQKILAYYMIFMPESLMSEKHRDLAG